MQGDQPVRCPNWGFCLHQPSAVPSVGGVLVVAGCVSVVRRWWWCKKSRDVVRGGVVRCRDWCSDKWWDVMWWQMVRCGARHEKCYARTYSLLHSFYKVLLSTTQYCPVYKVLLRTDYTVLQSITKYYSVPQSTAKYCSVLLCTTTKCHPVPQSTCQYYKVLLSTTKYYSATHETSSTLRGAIFGMQNTMELLSKPST